ncbi:MAG: hypothetical protein QM627_05295 [Luteolibacter sp.]
MKYLISYFFVVLLFSCEGANKREYAVLQVEQSASQVRIAMLPVVYYKNKDLIMIVGGVDGGKVSILLNPKSKPYYKQVPGNMNYSIEEDFYNMIKDSYKVDETVLNCLRSHVITNLNK